MTSLKSLTVDDCVSMRLQRLAGFSYGDIAENSGFSIKDTIEIVQRDIEGVDCSVPPITNEETPPWQEYPVIKHLLIDRNMHYTEIAELLGCHQETAKNWVVRHDVDMIESGQKTSSKTVTRLQRLGAKMRKERERKGLDEFGLPKTE